MVQGRDALQALAETTASVNDLDALIGGLLDQSLDKLEMENWDLLTTRHILANYGVTLSTICGERAAGMAWIGKMRGFLRVFPAAAYLDSLTLLDYYRGAGEVRAALDLSERARHEAAAALDFLRAFELTCIAGEQADRLGEHGRAVWPP